uniref:Uncharacterized protein n=1 Tax=Hyaloperonospora arabidopsidis (strain Emoy2) TaxID=559515 RepID=M4BNI8_HYAAE
MGACFRMALLIHRRCLVVRVDVTFNVNHQLGARHPAVVRRRITTPANTITRSLPPSRHGGSRYAPRESVDLRKSPPMAVVGARISTLNRLLELQADVGRLQ